MGIQFGYWAPLEKNGLLATNIPSRTSSSFEANIRYASIGEKVGYDYVLLPTRFISSSDSDEQWESLTMAAALAGKTEKIKLIAAVQTGLWPPAIVAKILTTIDHISNGRAAINIVSGWLKSEYLALGQPWLEHDERYRRSEEFIQVLRNLWEKEKATFQGNFYQIYNAEFKPHPVQKTGPAIFQGGNSIAARKMAGKFSDFYLMNGDTLEGLKQQIEEVRAYAASANRTVKFGVNAQVIVRNTEKEAKQVFKEIITNADVKVVESFREEVKQAGRSTVDNEGMWAKSTFEDLIQFNDGFKTGLIGTAEQVAERIFQLKEIGIDLILTGFLHFDEELELFGKKVIPLVRKLEKGLKNHAVHILS